MLLCKAQMKEKEKYLKPAYANWILSLVFNGF